MKPMLRALRAGCITTIAVFVYCGWQMAFGARVTDALFTSFIRAHVHAGADKAAVVRLIQSRGWTEWASGPPEPWRKTNPKDVDYGAESVISTGGDFEGPLGGLFGHIQVEFALDRHGKLIRFGTTRWYNGL